MWASQAPQWAMHQAWPVNQECSGVGFPAQHGERGWHAGRPDPNPNPDPNQGSHRMHLRAPLKEDTEDEPDPRRALFQARHGRASMDPDCTLTRRF